jgi:glycosyltransferase involved in cell wall biosynthesis
MRVALVHYWLLGQRGGEKVLEAIARLYPEADIFTLFYDPEAVSPYLRTREIYTSVLNPLRKIHRALLPLMPLALESFDLRSYDLVISSESGPAKGVLTSAKARHVCYCHTPMRYLWELSAEYRAHSRTALGQALFAISANYLRLWDYAAAARVDRFLANSRNVRQRIWKTWRRKAAVVYPPVDVETFRHAPSQDYYLIVSELVSYKRIDEAVRVFAQNGRKLKIAGGGPDFRTLKRSAAPNIEFCGRVPDPELRDLYAHSSALIVPGEEDFGITMVEALASGKPVIALARGGAFEIVQNGCGLLYEESLESAIRKFERVEHLFDPALLTLRAAEFSQARFAARFLEALNRRRRATSQPGAVA